MGLAVKCLFLLVIVATLNSFVESHPHAHHPEPKFDKYKKNNKKSYNDDYDDSDDYYEDHDSHYDDDCDDDHDHYDSCNYKEKKKPPVKKYDCGPPKKKNYKSCGCDDDCDCGSQKSYEKEYGYGKKQEYGYGKKKYYNKGYGKY